ncbi:hypothetical protein ACFWF7_44100, partial [Nocardia sp. NPDC060256]|uniref:hypothetical protein n=1 Tax=Nocardia sp. NPDC060256 TaxID=3347086 RepID=UPI00365A4AF1
MQIGLACRVALTALLFRLSLLRRTGPGRTRPGLRRRRLPPPVLRSALRLLTWLGLPRVMLRRIGPAGAGLLPCVRLLTGHRLPRDLLSGNLLAGSGLAGDLLAGHRLALSRVALLAGQRRGVLRRRVLAVRRPQPLLLLGPREVLGHQRREVEVRLTGLGPHHVEVHLGTGRQVLVERDDDHAAAPRLEVLDDVVHL